MVRRLSLTSLPYIRECAVTADASAIATAITTSVRTTVEATATTSRASLTEPKDLKLFTIDPAPSDFGILPAMLVQTLDVADARTAKGDELDLYHMSISSGSESSPISVSSHPPTPPHLTPLPFDLAQSLPP
jgi:hypothetical protein